MLLEMEPAEGKTGEEYTSKEKKGLAVGKLCQALATRWENLEFDLTVVILLEFDLLGYSTFSTFDLPDFDLKTGSHLDKIQNFASASQSIQGQSSKSPAYTQTDVMMSWWAADIELEDLTHRKSMKSLRIKALLFVYS